MRRRPLHLSSLQVRLLVAASLAVSGSLAVAGVGITFLFEQQMRALVGAGLSDTLRLLLAQVRREADKSLHVAHPPSDPKFATVYSGLYWQISSSDGASLRSRSLWDAALPIFADVPSGSGQRLFTAPGPFGRPVLIAEDWVEVESPDGPRPLEISVATDASAITDALHAFERPLAASFGVLACGLLVAAWIFVRSGLKPFNRLRIDLAAVHEGRSERLSGDYPDEVRPIVADLNALMDHHDAITVKARARAADLAHGLKTPLAVLDALVGDVREAGQSPLADEITVELVSMRGHVERELARARSGQAPVLMRRRTAIRPVVERLTNALTKIGHRPDIRFDIVCPPDALFDGSEDDLLEMLGNLLDNGCRWAKSLVRVTAERVEAGLSIRVEDDGPGLPGTLASAQIVRALRIDETKGGTGFGLAITKDIVECNRGRLDLGRSGFGGLAVNLRFQKG